MLRKLFVLSSFIGGTITFVLGVVGMLLWFFGYQMDGELVKFAVGAVILCPVLGFIAWAVDTVERGDET